MKHLNSKYVGGNIPKGIGHQIFTTTLFGTVRIQDILKGNLQYIPTPDIRSPCLVLPLFYFDSVSCSILDSFVLFFTGLFCTKFQFHWSVLQEVDCFELAVLAAIYPENIHWHPLFKSKFQKKNSDIFFHFFLIKKSNCLLPKRAVFWPYQGRIRAVSGPYQGRIRAVSGPYQGRIRAISLNLQKKKQKNTVGFFNFDFHFFSCEDSSYTLFISTVDQNHGQKHHTIKKQNGLQVYWILQFCFLPQRIVLSKNMCLFFSCNGLRFVLAQLCFILCFVLVFLFWSNFVLLMAFVHLKVPALRRAFFK